MPTEQGLRLFCAFHANLDFSAMPSVDVSLVVERCYWPLLEFARDGLALGIEMPARTLAILAEVDPEWIKTLRTEVERGRVEVLASGYAQIVAPLVPADVNRANFALGARRYAELLGAVPETWFINEQTFSRGLVDLYREAGARQIVMEWNNPASAQPALRPLRTRPTRVCGDTGALGLLWNDSIVFQRIQQCVHGTRPQQAATDLVEEIASRWGGGCLCVYGGDLEIFDYRPGQAPSDTEERGEMNTLGALLGALSKRFDLVLPRDAAEGMDTAPIVDPAGAADPMPCKKQPRYNPTRWAVSGRDGLGMNTRCYALHKMQRAGAAFSAPGPEAERALVELWRSDFRTRATEEKVEDFSEQMGAAQQRARRALEAAVPPLPEPADLLLINPWDSAWVDAPVEVELRFPPGRLRNARPRVVRAERAQLDAWQIESPETYRDGSLRRAIFVLDLRLEPGGVLAIHAEPCAKRRNPEPIATDSLDTGAVMATFNFQRGAALSALRFPAFGDRALAGTIEHGAFLDIAHSPDFYSGHVVAFGEEGQKVTDLRPVSDARVVAAGDIRLSLRTRVATEFGEWVKEWRLYHRTPRIDLRHDLRFPALRLASLRLGATTLLPKAWRRADLQYASVQGGAGPEVFRFVSGSAIDQGRAISAAVSASGCLGATEGWSSLADGRQGLLIACDQAIGAAVPMLTARDVDDSFFGRLEYSAAERDETRATFVRGIQSFAFAWLGFGGDPDPAREIAGRVARRLPLRIAEGASLARAL